MKTCTRSSPAARGGSETFQGTLRAQSARGRESANNDIEYFMIEIGKKNNNIAPRRARRRSLAPATPHTVLADVQESMLGASALPRTAAETRGEVISHSHLPARTRPSTRRCAAAAAVQTSPRIFPAWFLPHDAHMIFCRARQSCGVASRDGFGGVRDAVKTVFWGAVHALYADRRK